jgi:hypothetical protein
MDTESDEVRAGRGVLTCRVQRCWIDGSCTNVGSQSICLRRVHGRRWRNKSRRSRQTYCGYAMSSLIFTRLRSVGDAQRARLIERSRLHAQTKLIPA